MRTFRSARVVEGFSIAAVIDGLVNGSQGFKAVDGVELTAVLSGETATAWQWSTDLDGAIAGATSQTFTPQIGSNVTVGAFLSCLVTYSGGSVETAAFEVTEQIVAPVATGSISDQVFAHTGDVQTVVADVSTLFTGGGLSFGFSGQNASLNGNALEIDPASLTAGTTITLTATNDADTAQITFNLVVATLAFDGTPGVTGSGVIGELVTGTALSTLAGTTIEAEFLYDGAVQQARSATLTHTVVEDLDSEADALTATFYLTRDGVEVSQTVGGISTSYNAPSLGAAPGAQNYTVGAAITPLDIKASISVVGDADLSGASFALAPTSDPLPAGLSLSAVGVISGTPTETDAGNTIVVRATNSGGSVDVSFSMDVAAAASGPDLESISVTPGAGDTLDLTLTFATGTPAAEPINVYVFIDNPVDADPTAAEVAAGTGADATASGADTTSASGVTLNISGSPEGVKDVFVVAEFVSNLGQFSAVRSDLGIDFGTADVWDITDNGDGTFAINSIPPVPGQLQLTDNGDGTFAAEIV